MNLEGLPVEVSRKKGNIMKNVIHKEIMLPDHEKATGTHICHVCHGTMTPCIYEHMFSLTHQNAMVKVSGIHAHKCPKCGEVVYSSAEVKLIESEIEKVMDGEG